MTFLNNNPAPETEFAAEIAAAEKELAAPPPENYDEPAQDAPEPDTDQPEAEVAPAEKPAPEAREPEEKHTVPYAALKAERERIREMEREMHEMRKQFEQAKQPAKEPEPELDETQDPMAVIKSLKDKVARIEQEKQAESQQTTLRTAYQQAATAFAADKPDFKDAYSYMLQSRVKELKAYGYADQQIGAIVANEEMQLADQAFRARKNPGEIIYAMAESRGYRATGGKSPVVEAKPAPQPEPVDDNSPASPRAPDPVKVIEQQAAKAAAATTISGGGKPPNNAISMNDAAHLTGAAFDSWWDKNMAPPKKGVFAR